MPRLHLKLSFGLLSALLLVGAVAAFVGALVLLNRSHTVSVDAEVGKWLLTVAAAFVLTGALSMLVRQIDQRRSERQAWHDILNDLVDANQKVILARIRLQAHQSAKTYQEQLGEVMGARAEVRRIGALDIVNRDTSLSDQITKMREYLDALGQEYAAGYLPASRQQRLDEVWLDEKMKVANEGIGAPVLPQWLAGPTKAWLLLKNQSGFPRLAALLDERAFPIDTFRTNYKLAKERLEMHAGFGDTPIKSQVYRGLKLADRAKDFAILHAGSLEEKKLGAQVISMARQLKDACRPRPGDQEQDPDWEERSDQYPDRDWNQDPDVIRARTVDLGKLTSRAVARVYAMPQADRAAPEKSTAATPDGKTHSAAPPESPRPAGTDV
jgi:hypothetical protein